MSSRGLRKAPVKKTRSRWRTIATTKTSAAQWWVWRISSPAFRSRLRVDHRAVGLAHVLAAQRRDSSRGRRPASCSARRRRSGKRRSRRGSRNAYSAISPSRNDQWSGKTYRSALRRNGAAPARWSRKRTARCGSRACAPTASLPTTTGRPGRRSRPRRGGGRRHRRRAAAAAAGGRLGRRAPRRPWPGRMSSSGTGRRAPASAPSARRAGVRYSAIAQPAWVQIFE